MKKVENHCDVLYTFHIFVLYVNALCVVHFIMWLTTEYTLMLALSITIHQILTSYWIELCSDLCVSVCVSCVYFLQDGIETSIFHCLKTYMCGGVVIVPLTTDDHVP